MPQSESSRRLLLIAFKFPPYAEVGARRWAKLAKYLARDGVEVHVLTVPWGETRDPRLDADAAEPGVHIHRIPSLGPHLLRHRALPPGTIRRRLRDATWRRIRGREFVEEARHWGYVMLPAARRLIERHRLSAVVVSGTPFWANVWAARLKGAGGIRLVQEFRDPWSDLPEVKGLPEPERRRVEALERTVLDSADTVVTVTESLADVLRAVVPAADLRVINNGFDPEDFPPSPSDGPRELTLLYAGNAGAGREEPLEALLDRMRVGAGRRQLPRLRFFGAFPPGVIRRYEDLIEKGLLQVAQRIPADAISSEITSAFACLHLNQERFPYAASTKIYEYGYARRPVLSVNYGGEPERLVREHRLGWSVDARDPQAIDEALDAIVETWRRDPAHSIEPLGFDRYDFRNLAKQYEDILFG